MKHLSYVNHDQSFGVNYEIRQNGPSMPVEHVHNNYEIYYLFGGERNYFIKDRVYCIQKGNVVLIPKHIVHKTIYAGVPVHERIVLNITENYLDRFQDEQYNLFSVFHRGRPVLTLNVSDQRFIEDLLLRILKEANKKSSIYELYLQALTIELLIFISRCEEHSEHTSLQKTDKLYNQITDVVCYINNNFMKPLTLPALSDHFYISTSHLSRLFKEVSGFTFTEYMNIVRIKEAQKLLRETNFKVADIAETVGFGNIAHFGRVFKENTNITPLQYRSLNKKKSDKFA